MTQILQVRNSICKVLSNTYSNVGVEQLVDIIINATSKSKMAHFKFEK
jgi:hypothetical protein